MPSKFYAQRFAVVGDIHGAGTGTLEVSNLIKSWNPDFIITLGDNYYPYVSCIDSQVGQFYHEFINPYIGIYGQGDTVNRFFPAIGNHDIENNGIINYLNYFVLPNNERYYDFVKGDVHFFVLNSNTNEPDGIADTSIQAQWLENKLAASVSDYNIVYFHHPPFSSGYHGSNTYMQWPFRQWGATAVLSSHDHYYERLIINGFPFFINGAGGGTLYTVYNYVDGSQFHYSLEHGAMLVDANNDSILFEFFNISDSLIDKYSINNNQPSNNDEPIKNKLNIFQNEPNPFTSNTMIKFYLPRQGKVEIKIYDVFGKEIGILLDRYMDAGFYDVKWEANKLKNGVYFYCLYFENIIKVNKAMVFDK